MEFFGHVARVRLGGEHSAGELAIIDSTMSRGSASPVHRHLHAAETFLVLEGTLRVRVDREEFSVGAGSVAVLPKLIDHAFLVTSDHARLLSLHTPAGFDEFVLGVGHPPELTDAAIDSEELARIAVRCGIELVGPPMTL
ncbi:cupin domain-containing protein [Actinopolymorpha sp. B11F2]|uniref:cupin domain-containing protein n=1 Tax=Actinopolymorpha sp. B11F2 TaxID=3160862 RepID=UPI0032E4C57B